MNDVGLVGGKTASLGELYSVLSAHGVAVPNGFAITADAYRDALRQPGVADELHRLLDGLDKSKIKLLAAAAARARNIIDEAMDTEPLRAQIVEAYRQFEQESGAGVALPPSSPTVQFPTASTTVSITSRSRSPLP